jgi:hypothetical protein
MRVSATAIERVGVMTTVTILARKKRATAFRWVADASTGGAVMGSAGRDNLRSSFGGSYSASSVLVRTSSDSSDLGDGGLGVVEGSRPAVSVLQHFSCASGFASRNVCIGVLPKQYFPLCVQKRNSGKKGGNVEAAMLFEKSSVQPAPYRSEGCRPNERSGLQSVA